MTITRLGTISRNGKRIPAKDSKIKRVKDGAAGKPKKAGAKAQLPKDGKKNLSKKEQHREVERLLGGPNVTSDQRKLDSKARKEKQTRAIAAAVKKLTELSPTTAGQLNALVLSFDEHEKEANLLRETIAGLKGSIGAHKEELRKASREAKALEREKKRDELADLGKKMGGLEQDLERWESHLHSRTEERNAHRESMKACMGEIRKIVKQHAAGELLFDQKKEVAKEKKGNGGKKAPVAVDAARPEIEAQNTYRITNQASGGDVTVSVMRVEVEDRDDLIVPFIAGTVVEIEKSPTPPWNGQAFGLGAVVRLNLTRDFSWMQVASPAPAGV